MSLIRGQGHPFQGCSSKNKTPSALTQRHMFLAISAGSFFLYHGWEQQPCYFMLAQAVLFSIHYHPLPSKSTICLMGARGGVWTGSQQQCSADQPLWIQPCPCPGHAHVLHAPWALLAWGINLWAFAFHSEPAQRHSLSRESSSPTQSCPS